MHVRRYIAALASIGLTIAVSCSRIDSLGSRVDSLESVVAKLEADITALNRNTIAANMLFKDCKAILSVEEIENGYIIRLSDGSEINIYDGSSIRHELPIIGINENGEWIISTDNGKTFEILEQPEQYNGYSPQVRTDEDGYWQISIDNGTSWTYMTDSNGKKINASDGKETAGKMSFFSQIIYSDGDDSITFVLIDGREVTLDIIKSFALDILDFKENTTIYLGETLTYTLVSYGIKEISVSVPEDWKASIEDGELKITSPENGQEGSYTIQITAVSDEGFIRHYDLKLNLDPTSMYVDACREWLDFEAGRESNILADYSYAGYMRGEQSPAEFPRTGYRQFDITDYGAIADDGLSDRQAFLDMLTDILGEYETDQQGNIVFPHKAQADAIINFPKGKFILYSDQDQTGRSIIIRAGNLIIKGEGRDLTTIEMASALSPDNAEHLYSSPDMLQFKHFSGHSSFNPGVSVSGTARKGTFSICVSSTLPLRTGDWICLYVKNNDIDFIEAELSPYTAQENWDIVRNGIEIIEYHQIRRIDRNIVTFYEPILHDVDGLRGWEVLTFPHYENIGIEDLRFIGHAKEDFVHHGSWEDDGGYKPLSISRAVNSWITRVDFESVSEACSIISCANVSAYDIKFKGNNGHSTVRSQASSRVLIAATEDLTTNGGCFHGVGVSRQSIGTVLWNNRWGDKSCFESHATQPRETLIDCCQGGWHRGHQGGDSEQAPHHLAGLTIWNFIATDISETVFPWWDESVAWWRFLPPAIIGFQSGTDVIFEENQTLTDSCHGIQAQPGSLYEAQLYRRLRRIPDWLTTLKNR